MIKSKFAAFIMTYERHEILLDTISKIRSQTFPPDKILIVDNSESFFTKRLIEELNLLNVFYYRVGKNLGPANAAKIGLEILRQEGYDWVYWGDDDDPPKNVNIFEDLFKILRGFDVTQVGALGSVGAYFNKYTGTLQTIKNKHITSDVIDVDSIPGGHNFIVNCKLLSLLNIYPTPKLFYGFEELDFCLKMKKANLKLLIDGKTILENRIRKGLVDPNYKWKGKSFGDETRINRSYYSVRNMVYILYKNNYFIALVYNWIKNLIKVILGFRYGCKYGKRNLELIVFGYIDAITNSFGKRI